MSSHEMDPEQDEVCLLSDHDYFSESDYEFTLSEIHQAWEMIDTGTITYYYNKLTCQTSYVKPYGYELLDDCVIALEDSCPYWFDTCNHLD
jgi:hypothetical protein